MMTKAELLKKNAAIILARQEKAKEQELAKAVVEAEEIGSTRENIEIVEEQKEEQPKKKKGGRKPANRQYMVVDGVGINEEDPAEEPAE